MRRLLLLPVLLLAPAASAQDLTTTIADALSHSPTLAQAQSEEAVAKARLDAAQAERNPQGLVQGQIGYGWIDNGGFFGIGPKNVTPLAVQVGAEMPLFTGGRLAAAQDQARGGVELATLGMADARSRIMVGAVAAYVEVLTARQIEARFRQLTGELAEVERQAGLRFTAGEIPASERAAATARRAEGEAGLANAEGRRVSAEAQYLRLTGHAAGQLAALPALPEVPATLDEAIDAAHRANPTLAQAEKGIDIAKAGQRAAKADAMPTLGAFAEASHTRDQFFPDYRADAVSVGVRGRWVLWSGGRNAAKRDEADAQLDASEALAREARDQLDSAIISAWTGLKTAHHMVSASAARSAATAEALRSTQLEAKVGAKPTLAVLDAEREAIAAQAAEIEAQGQRLIAAWQLNALAGRLNP